ncbi:MAG: sulfite exporter TauE/SafE family protein [Acidimicrobiia bacterium]
MNPDLILILAAAAFAFFVKGVAGFGGPLLAVPILAPTFGVEHAVAVISIGNFVSNLLMLWEHRIGFADTRSILFRMLTAGAGGTVLGTWLLTRLDNRPLALTVAIIVIAYIVLALTRPTFRVDPQRGLTMAWSVGAFGGLVHGATGNSGPVFGTFLHSLGLARSSFVFAVTVPFLVFGGIQIITLVGLGGFSDDRWSQALWAIVPVVVATPIGTRVARKLNQQTFGRVVLALLAFTAIRLGLSTFGI